jgi:hypothetical protein
MPSGRASQSKGEPLTSRWTSSRSTVVRSALASRSSRRAPIGASGVVGVRLGSRFELVARVGAGYPLIRDSFEFAPNTFHRVAPVTLAGSLGLELHEP